MHRSRDRRSIYAVSSLPVDRSANNPAAPRPWAAYPLLYDAFGPDRLVWGSYGTNMQAFRQQLALVEEMFDFAADSERKLIRGR